MKEYFSFAWPMVVVCDANVYVGGIEAKVLK